MSKQAFKRVRKHLKMEVTRKPLDSWAWPGGYPLYYLCNDGEAMCPTCVNENIVLIDDAIKLVTSDRRLHDDWALEAVDVNYEDPDLICCNCDKRIESAYAEPAATPDEQPAEGATT